jgi:CHAT domain-containing protein
VELLTLSACNTAMGGESNGREVEGFGELAQKQGALAVVATLWAVSDESTGKLMQEFYRLRTATPGMTKGEALREAQLALLRGQVKKGEGGTADQRTSKAVGTGANASGQPQFKYDPDRPYAHPYYWAPFILIGNWK